MTATADTGTISGTVYTDTDHHHVEHWDHPKPPRGVPCSDGTMHLMTFGPQYKVGGLLGLILTRRAARDRLAELLGLPVEDVAEVSLCAFAGDRPGPGVGFSFEVRATDTTRYLRLTYDPDRLWTYCLDRHDMKWWRYKHCGCAVSIEPGPVALVVRAAAEAARSGL